MDNGAEGLNNAQRNRRMNKIIPPSRIFCAATCRILAIVFDYLEMEVPSNKDAGMMLNTVRGDCVHAKRWRLTN